MVAWLDLWHRLSMTRLDRGIAYADPIRAGRHPFQVYILGLCVVSGVPVVAGLATPSSLERALPPWLVFTWSLFLLVGAAVALIGVYWPRSVLTALTTERIGLALVGVAAYIYGPLLFVRLSWPGLLAAVIIVAFGGSCIRRARDIGRIIQTAIQMVRMEHDQ